LIEEGYLGRCFHVHFYHLSGFGRDATYRWGYDRRRALGILGNLGSHLIDLARWYVGDIARVSAQLTTFVERPGSEGEPFDPANDSAMVMLQFANGAQGMIHVSSVAHLGERGMEQRFVFHGEAGMLEFESNLAEGYRLRSARGQEGQIRTISIPEDILAGIDSGSPLMAQFHRVFTEQAAGSRLFVEAIVKDRPISPNFRDGLKVQEVIEAAMEADQRRCWISL
jgi:predicted dehydrogenase